MEQKILNEVTAINSINISNESLQHLLPFQINAVRANINALRKRGIAISGDDPGCGKTYIACAAAKELGLGIFVITTKPGIPNFFEVAQTFENKILGIVNYESIKNGKHYISATDFTNEIREDCPYIKVTRTQLKDPVTGDWIRSESGRIKEKISNIEWTLPENTLIIFDEAHKGKTGLAHKKDNSGNNILLTSIKTYLKPTVKVMFLSATITDRLECFDGICYIIGLINEYSAREYRAFTARLGATNETKLKKINHIMYPFYGSRLRASDIQEYFNECDISSKIFKINSEAAEEIEKLHRLIAETMQELRNRGSSQGLGFIIRCWSKIEVLKAPTVVNEVIRDLEQGCSVVVFVNFTATIDVLLAGLSELPVFHKYKHGIIDGKSKDRQETIEKFRSDELRLIITNIKSGGTSVSLHDINGNYPRTSYVFPTWSSIDFRQALGRIHRVGGKTKAKQYVVYVGDSDDESMTVEVKLCESMYTKLKNIELINNGELLLNIDFHQDFTM